MNLFAVFEIVLISSLYFFYIYRLTLNINLKKYFWTFSVIFFILMKSRDLDSGFLNQDELQWLVSANSMRFDSFKYFNYYITGEISRVLTIAPLAICGFFSDFIELIQSRILNILMFLSFFYFQLKIIKIIFSSDLRSYIITSIYITSIAFGFNSDLASYNSEIVVINLLSLSFLFYLNAKQSNRSFQYIFAGSAATLIALAKEQAFPIALFLLFYFCLDQLINKKFKKTLFVLFGSLIIQVFFIYIVYITKSFERLKLLFECSKIYLEKGLGGNKYSFQKKAQFFFENNYLETTNGLFGFLAFFGIILLFRNYREFKLISIESFFIGLFLITLFVTINPGNSFYHYSILHYFCLMFFASYCVYHLKFRPLYIFAFVFLANLKSGIINNKTFFPISRFFKQEKKLANSDMASIYLSKELKPLDHLLVWGWENQWYLKSKSLKSSYFPSPVFLENHYPNREKLISIYCNDIKNIKPKIIFEAVGPGRFFFTDINKWRINHISYDLSCIVNKNYDLVLIGDNFRIFKLRKEYNHQKY